MDTPLALALTSISEAHKLAGHKSPRSAPIVRQTWKGIKRELGVAQRRVEPVTVDVLRSIIQALPDNLRGKRDRALLNLGFGGAFRRSELAALDMEDISFTDDGLVVKIRKSKTDQEGEGTNIGIPYGGNPATCPVRTVRSWLESAGIEQGSVFRSVTRHGKVGGRLNGHDVARIVKRAVKA